MTVPHVYQAIQAVQQRFSADGLAKSRDNQQQGFKFRGIDDVYNSLSTYLVEANLLIIPRLKKVTSEVRMSAQGKPLNYTTVEVEYIFVSSVDGSEMVACMAGEAMDSGDKATNKAMSAAYKYLCLQTFCIPTEGDNDADGTTHEMGTAKQQRPARDVGEKMTVQQHIEAMKSAVSTEELKRAFAKAWKQHEDPNDPRLTTKEQAKLKVAYDAALHQLTSRADEEPPSDSVEGEGHGSE